MLRISDSDQPPVDFIVERSAASWEFTEVHSAVVRCFPRLTGLALLQTYAEARDRLHEIGWEYPYRAGR